MYSEFYEVGSGPGIILDCENLSIEYCKSASSKQRDFQPIRHQISLKPFAFSYWVIRTCIRSSIGCKVRTGQHSFFVRDDPKTIGLFYIVSYYINLVKTSQTYSMYKIGILSRWLWIQPYVSIQTMVFSLDGCSYRVAHP